VVEAHDLGVNVQNAKSFDRALALCSEQVQFEFSGRTVRNGTKGASFIMKAGKYVVADPCYILERNVYDALLDNEGAWTGERPVVYGDNASVWILPTANGDGQFPGSDGKTYGVDSGHLAIIEICDCPTLFFRRDWQEHPQFDVNADFTCERTDDGELVFGNFLTVFTDGQKCPECKDRYCDGCEFCGDCPQYCNCERDKEDEDEE
jgi:hypothetical protein